MDASTYVEPFKDTDPLFDSRHWRKEFGGCLVLLCIVVFVVVVIAFCLIPTLFHDWSSVLILCALLVSSSVIR